MGASQIPAASTGGTEADWVLISSVTASGTTVSFTSISGYSKLALMWKGVNLSVADNAKVTIDSNTGTNYNNVYQSTAATPQNFSLSTSFLPTYTTASVTTGVIYIDAVNKTGFKPVYGSMQGTTAGAVYQDGSYYYSTAATTSVQLTTGGGTATMSVGTVALYGVVA